MSEAPSGQQYARMPFFVGIDGMRALAVVAVLFYHADLFLFGGYLGVESFFVLSGFLITGLLFAEWENTQRVDFKDFWVRRARRLLPALLVFLAGTLALAMVVVPNEVEQLSRDMLAALGYVTNWYLIASGQSYFDASARPSLVRHLWSLAIEEQFYIVWPLLFLIGMRLLRLRGFLALVLLGAAASAVAMAVWYMPGADPSRLYYGTDTRAFSILIGAALALWIAPHRMQPSTRRFVPLALDAGGLLALVGLLAAYVWMHEQMAFVYRGGMVLVSLATALVILAIIHPSARLLPRLLSLPPLGWIGARSYGIYLWHWPIFMLTWPGFDVAYTGWWWQAARFAAAIALAALSYTLVEQPIRRGALKQVWQMLRARHAASRSNAPRTPMRRWRPLVAASTLSVAVMFVAGGVSQAAIAESQSRVPSGVAATEPTVLAETAIAQTAVVAEQTAVAEGTSGETSEAAASEPAAETTTPEPVAEPAGMDPALAEQLQQVLDQAVANDEVPGVALALRLADGTTWSTASGVASTSTDAALTPTTRMRIGSLSKMFTGVVVLQLAEEGVIDLDAPIEANLPGLLPEGELITPRLLLQHRTGLYDYLEDRRLVSEAYQFPDYSWNPERIVEYATGFPSSFPPGAEDSWDYSNTNFLVLGILVEEATGSTLSQQIHERILTPLEMQSTYVLPEDTVEGEQAAGYSGSVDQSNVAMGVAFGTASVVSTVEDMQRFGTALFNGELLQPETQEQMYQFVDGKGQYDMPELEYGLALMRNRLAVEDVIDGVTPDPESSRVIGHIGGFGGFRTAMWYAPASETLFVLDMNQAGVDPNDLSTRVMAVLLQNAE